VQQEQQEQQEQQQEQQEQQQQQQGQGQAHVSSADIDAKIKQHLRIVSVTRQPGMPETRRLEQEHEQRMLEQARGKEHIEAQIEAHGPLKEEWEEEELE
jgi:hypothetical protein